MKAFKSVVASELEFLPPVRAVTRVAMPLVEPEPRLEIAVERADEPELERPRFESPRTAPEPRLCTIEVSVELLKPLVARLLKSVEVNEFVAVGTLLVGTPAKGRLEKSELAIACASAPARDPDERPVAEFKTLVPMDESNEEILVVFDSCNDPTPTLAPEINAVTTEFRSLLLDSPAA
jgi:hypothetical protein